MPIPLIPIMALAGAWTLLRDQRATSLDTAEHASTVYAGSVTMKQWETLVATTAPFSGIPIGFALKWIEVESGGNPCAIGSATAKGPDGNPQEMGLAQLYNPDDLSRFGATGKELRAYCVAGTQKLSRPLTGNEMLRQVQLTVALIVRCRQTANADLDKVGATWDRDLVTSPDMRKLTKLQHGLPGLSRSGLPAVTKRLGRAPASWSEFRSILESLPPTALDAGTARYASVWGTTLGNAEKTGVVA